MSEFTKEELKEILKLHRKWLMDEEGGERADLSYAYLSGADLSCANLSDAILRGANLKFANLGSANLSDADMRDVDLTSAYLREAKLSGANIKFSNLTDADFGNADLSYTECWGTDFSDVNLRGAKLNGSSLYGAVNINSVIYDVYTSMFTLSCPEDGAFVGYKKARLNGIDRFKNVIVKLQITEDAKRSSATTRKCRCNKAVVLGIYDFEHNELPSDTIAYSRWDLGFTYKVGETVEPTEPFEEDRWLECASGIHFFMTFDEAVKY
ncbi:MAG: pentapeptide repeat-containing protein [Clostridium lundense]|nr:pentapeptide repeat-containing protein [Clostridium lundense]